MSTEPPIPNGSPPSPGSALATAALAVCVLGGALADPAVAQFDGAGTAGSGAILVFDDLTEDADDDGLFDDEEDLDGDGDLENDDTDDDGLPNYLDDDDDDDGIPTWDEAVEEDEDGDGLVDYLDPVDNRLLAGFPVGSTVFQCAAGGLGQPGAPVPACLLFLLLCCLSWRLRLGHRKDTSTVVAGLTTATLACLWLLPTNAASAQIRLAEYRPPALITDGFLTARATIPKHLHWGLLLSLDYANQPLVVELNPGDPASSLGRGVTHHTVSNAHAALGLFDRLMVYGGLHLNLQMAGDAVHRTPSADRLSPGDVQLGIRVLPFSELRGPLGFAMELEGAIPVANAVGNYNYAGEEIGAIGPRAILSLAAEAIEVTANVGARFRKRYRTEGAMSGSQLTYAAAANGMVGRVRVSAELAGTALLQPFAARAGSNLEGLLGARWLPCWPRLAGWGVGAGLSAGLLPGLGTPRVRLVATVGYAPPQHCPTESRTSTPRNEPQAGPSTDAPGATTLPVSAASMDTDADSITDDIDACANEAEDPDGFEDADGCPDPDNDGDGVLDPHDGCPLAPGPHSNLGCPLKDRDVDGVVDVLDNCPDEPGVATHFGCTAPQLVTLTEATIEIRDRIFFDLDAATIKKQSHDLLDNLAEVLTAHPEILEVVVEGHTDSDGSSADNLLLSERRAEAVIGYLVEHGVGEARLVAKGCGEGEPVADNGTKGGRAKNRRVEFKIAQRKER